MKCCTYRTIEKFATCVFTDEENEYVSFSSDDELIDALTQNQGGFFRVYVKGIKIKLQILYLIAIK